MKTYNNAEEILGHKIQGRNCKVAFRFGRGKLKKGLRLYQQSMEMFGKVSFVEDAEHIKETGRFKIYFEIKNSKLYETLIDIFQILKENKASDAYCKLNEGGREILVTFLDDHLVEADKSITLIDSLVNKGTSQYRLEQELGHKNYLMIILKPKSGTILRKLDQHIRAYLEDKTTESYSKLKKYIDITCSKSVFHDHITTWDYPNYSVGNDLFLGLSGLAMNFCFLERYNQELVVAFSDNEISSYKRVPEEDTDKENVINLLEFFNAMSKEFNAFISSDDSNNGLCYFSYENCINENEYDSETKEYS
jgi:hypothetical protein